MTRPSFSLWVLTLIGVGVLGAPQASRGSGRAQPPPQFTFDRFAPAGLGISVKKPKSMVLNSKPSRKGYRTFQGIEPVTKTRLTLYVRKSPRSQVALQRDLAALTTIPAAKWITVFTVNHKQGFAWQQGLLSHSRQGHAIAALTARHGKKQIVYLLVVEVAMAVAIKYLGAYKTAYSGLRAIP